MPFYGLYSMYVLSSLFCPKWLRWPRIDHILASMAHVRHKRRIGPFFSRMNCRLIAFFPLSFLRSLHIHSLLLLSGSFGRCLIHLFRVGQSLLEVYDDCVSTFAPCLRVHNDSVCTCSYCRDSAVGTRHLHPRRRRRRHRGAV